MIAKSIFKLEIGKRYDGPNYRLNDGYGNWHNIPFLVLRETTREEFIESCNRDGIPLGAILNQDYFYEVSID